MNRQVDTTSDSGHYSVHIWSNVVRNGNGQMQQPVVYSKFVTLLVSVLKATKVRPSQAIGFLFTEYVYAVWFQYRIVTKLLIGLSHKNDNEPTQYM